MRLSPEPLGVRDPGLPFALVGVLLWVAVDGLGRLTEKVVKLTLGPLWGREKP